MIDAKELRIGNLVEYNSHIPIGYNRPQIPVTKILEIRGSYVDTDEGIRKYKEIDPIPLTENILIKSGGNKISDNEIVFSCKNKDTDKEGFSVIIKSGIFYLNNKDCKDLSVPIESVHKFQNLYYELIGEEINIILR